MMFKYNFGLNASVVVSYLDRGTEVVVGVLGVFLFKQKTAYEMRISDWSSDVCSSDLPPCAGAHRRRCARPGHDHKRDHRKLAPRHHHGENELGRASCRERVGQYV